MRKKAVILDLDNTIYPVSSIGDKLFKELFDLIKSRGEYKGDFEEIRNEIMRAPFQKVARDFSFSEALTTDGVQMLKTLSYNDAMYPFDDYFELSKTDIHKHLVTVGFAKMQWSKIKQLNIEKDFKSIYVIDPTESGMTKKDAFMKIMDENHYKAPELLVVGDDADSEIKAGREAGIDSVLYDREGLYSGHIQLPVISNFKELPKFFEGIK